MSTLAGAETLRAHAFLLGERLDPRAASLGTVLTRAPWTVRLPEGGIVVLYRYGAAVLIDVAPAQERGLVERLAPTVLRPFDEPAGDDVVLRVSAAEAEGVAADGAVVLPDAELERLRVVAEALARSALLAHYERTLADAVDRIEPLAERLRREGRAGMGGRRLLGQLGEVLAIETRMVGRAEVTEKPELVWERPDLDRLYDRLAEEFELAERDRALTRKLELLTRTSETLLEVLRHRSSLRVEWAIVALIVVEIVILIYDLFVRG